MTRNLAIGCDGSGSTYGSNVSSKSLTIADSNVSSAWSTPTELLSTPGISGTSNGYVTAALQCDSIYGAWYNYKAVTAGTIEGDSDSMDTTYDICPRNWRLFTKNEYENLINTIGSSPSIFQPVAGGAYYDSTTSTWIDYGHWWSVTADGVNSRYAMLYSSGNNQLSSLSNNRSYGYYARCVSPS